MGDEGRETSNPVFLMLLILVSLGYCYSLVSKIPKGLLRLILVLPIYYLFSIFPWCFSSSILRGLLSYFITWISSFKLLLFCFQRGPLANTITFIDFLLVSILPFKIKDQQVPPSDLNKHRIYESHSSVNFYLKDPNPPLSFQGSKSGLCMVSKYGAVLAGTLKRYEVLPLFNQPYLATSLQDFWGRRWNLLSSYILRLTVYNPTRETLTGVVGIGPAKAAATITTLAVSGVMHEMMFYYITCGMKPTWEVTCFFLSQGSCMVLEAILKKHFRSGKEWPPTHAALANAFTLGFVLLTSYYLLILPVWNNGQHHCNTR